VARASHNHPVRATGVMLFCLPDFAAALLNSLSRRGMDRCGRPCSRRRLSSRRDPGLSRSRHSLRSVAAQEVGNSYHAMRDQLRRLLHDATLGLRRQTNQRVAILGAAKLQAEGTEAAAADVRDSHHRALPTAGELGRGGLLEMYLAVVSVSRGKFLDPCGSAVRNEAFRNTPDDSDG